MKHLCLGPLTLSLFAATLVTGVAMAAEPHKSGIDYGCGANQRLITFSEVDQSGGDQGKTSDLTAFGQAACNIMGEWDILRLSDGGSMGGSGYDCHHFVKDNRTLGGSLCVAYTAISVANSETCGAGQQLMAVQEALARLEEIKPFLGVGYISRLAGGGSIGGPDYNYEILPNDTRTLGHAICTQLAQ